MSDLGDRQIGQLSAGQQQRVLIARALATRPRLLILDEPAAALDPNVGHSLYALLDKLGQDITIIMVTHDMGVLYRTVSKVACLSQRLFTHEDAERLDPKALEKAYGCPIDLIAHGDFPHRVFEPHCGDSGEE
jgi:zinc transport system ATP-binding protein